MLKFMFLPLRAHLLMAAMGVALFGLASPVHSQDQRRDADRPERGDRPDGRQLERSGPDRSPGNHAASDGQRRPDGPPTGRPDGPPRDGDSGRERSGSRDGAPRDRGPESGSSRRPPGPPFAEGPPHFGGPGNSSGPGNTGGPGNFRGPSAMQNRSGGIPGSRFGGGPSSRGPGSAGPFGSRTGRGFSVGSSKFSSFLSHSSGRSPAPGPHF
ncbi:MAG: hypothetical protein KDA85_09440, partial [Planctomycetaceae bacterium]|nr:hypothetical protein [Planctomycetaceae bacterium]